jgi:hypothetical protein
MRYRDAPHVSVGSFYSGNHQWGKCYRFAGYAGIVAACLCRGEPEKLAVLMVVLLLLWLFAWYQVVGTLWRSSLVAALLLGAVEMTMVHCAASGVQP